MRWFSPTWIALLIAAFAGCAQPTKRVDPWTMIAVGIDPVNEARAVETRMQRASYRAVSRVEGRSFVALGFARPDGATSVRVVTRAGIAMMLDAPRAESSILSVGLVEGEGGDLDGDGDEELLLTLLGREDVRACIGVLRVLASGRVAEVPIEAGEVHGEACLEDVRHTSGRAEGELVVRATRWGLEPEPHVSLAIVAHGGRWVRSPSDSEFLEAEDRRREGALTEARRTHDAEGALRIGIERAMIARARGEGAATQVERIDAAMRGLVLTPALAERHRAVRAHFVASGRSSSSHRSR